ncbi:MAG: hypothetical protein COA85_04065 [Robiginitomaculum sp.]|nr:MAG: hypothetical protein COA85_04065 [Robiginitomaculum sp.]
MIRLLSRRAQRYALSAFKSTVCMYVYVPIWAQKLSTYGPKLAFQWVNAAYCSKEGLITDDLVHFSICCARRFRRLWKLGGLNLLSMKFKGMMSV